MSNFIRQDDEVYCGFCGEEMVEQEIAYVSNYVGIYYCNNHDVFYLITDDGKYELYGKDGYEIVNTNGEGFFSKRKMKITDKPEDVYGETHKKHKILLRTTPIDVNIYTFDKVVKKLKKLVPFS